MDADSGYASLTLWRGPCATLRPAFKVRNSMQMCCILPPTRGFLSKKKNFPSPKSVLKYCGGDRRFFTQR